MVKITVVYDNLAVKAELKTGWGFSSLIETDHAQSILFDTGADGAALLYNMKLLDIDPESIQAVVISHAHGDHTGGLSDILSVNRNAAICIPASTRMIMPERKVVMVSQPVQISDGVFSTGELKGIEQSLAVRTAKGIVVVTGCSHPGVATILDAASSHGKIYGIIGGFHGFRDFNCLDDISLICPCHCTQYKSDIQRRFPDRHVACGAGLELEL